MNILEAIFQAHTNPPIPMHVGEAFTLWAYYEAAAETRAICRVLFNHTDDVDLKETLEHFLADVVEPQIDKVKGEMMHRGIALPNSTPDSPTANPKDIPVGARFVDEQIANMIVIKIQGMLMFCYEGMSRTLQQNLGAMYFGFQSQILAQGQTLSALMRKRGWLRVPPPFGAPVSPKTHPSH